MNLSQHDIDLASGVSYGASGMTFLIGTLTLHEVASIIGMVGVVSTVGINWYYKHQNFKLNLRERKRRDPE